MALDTPPFYINLSPTEFREFAHNAGLLEDEYIVLEAYAVYARENDTLSFSAARITDSLVARGEEENIPKLRTLPNVRRLMTQTAYTLRDKNFLTMDIENGEILKIYLIDPIETLLSDYYLQMQSNSTMPFPEDDLLQKYITATNTVEVLLSESGGGTDERLQEEKRTIRLRFNESIPPVYVTSKTLDPLLDACFLKLKYVILNAAQNRLGEDLVKDMQHIMPQKTTTIDRINRILSRTESEAPLYIVNLANRLAAYFTIDKDKKGMMTLIQAARIIEAFKGYEAWIEAEKNNKDKLKENALKLASRMADFPELLTRSDIAQKIIRGAVGLENLSSSTPTNEVDALVNLMLADFTVFQAEERELLPMIVKVKISDEDFYIHREAVLIFFESERKRVRDELLARFRKMWYALMLRNESRSAMEFDEFFAEDVQKYIKNHEPVFSALLVNPQLIVNAFHVVSRHPINASLQETYFVFGNRVIFRPLHSLLNLSRREILSRIRSELPFLFRYPFLRWLLSIFGIGSANAPPPVEHAESEPVTHGQTVLQDTEWHRILTMVETKLIGEKSATEVMRKLQDMWNQKLGEARKQMDEIQ
ncbi:MAG TPA: hypothetical protein PLY93_00880 [Turneriella sp.]|nr:hypothetical protein [Turneriella sp.]